MNRKDKTIKLISELQKLFPDTKIALNFSNPIELLVAVVLSAQTTDRQVNVVTTDLFKKYQTLNDYLKTPLTEFEQDIKSIGLYKGKAKNIKAALELIKNIYHGKIPDSMEELIKLPGVGRKTASVVLGITYGVVEGIAVDTHVRRLSQLFGFSKSSNPDIIERDLMAILPKSEWQEFTFRMIDYGRTFCPASCKHTDCPLREFIVK